MKITGQGSNIDGEIGDQKFVNISLVLKHLLIPLATSYSLQNFLPQRRPQQLCFPFFSWLLQDLSAL